MKDYLIVGGGLAGIAFAETALQNNRSIAVVDNGQWHASRVSGGVYNPVVLKRLNAVVHAASYLEIMRDFFDSVETRLGQSFRTDLPIYRRFASVEEQNDWFTAADKPSLASFLSTRLVTRQIGHVKSPFGFGRVLETGYVDTARFLSAYTTYLKENGWFVHASPDYDTLKRESEIRVGAIDAKHIVFSEGFGMLANPFFNMLPLEGTKGELLTIHAPELQLDAIIKAGVFIVPLGNGRFKVGSTYNWADKTELPTAAARDELEAKLKEVVTCEYEVVAHDAGIRPTVKDRKPLVGTHPQFSNLHLLNGLGTRGVMLAPAMAKYLFDAIENANPLPPEIDLRRFLR
jgi:glycine/D-amino acid oxidase-like deaminating enzyme